ncbi:DNA-3-methyladenine glycosylase, partial [Candidatus Falkowbacteria bacterium]|nr:DNA-3-methyladenine glycosylase [Candidatus Falkowbacteria bacterium]
MKELSSAFFAKDTLTVAQELLGKIISINGMQVRIVETEAYGTDPASHAYTKTARSTIMYETHGYVYVYLIYGMYWCLNFTSDQNQAGAVLIRAVEPIQGIKSMKKNRNIE